MRWPTAGAPRSDRRRALDRLTRHKGLTALGALAGVGVLLAGPVSAISNAAPTSRGSRATLASSPRATSLAFVHEWSVALPDDVAQSSPILDDIDNTRVALVGDLDGKVYALSLLHGREPAGWPATDPGSVPIQSTPSVYGGIIYVGTGDAGHPSPGGYLALNSNGSQRWYRTIGRTPTDSSPWGVQSGITVGVLQGQETVIAGTMGQEELELGANTGRTMPGFPWFAADSEFDTPSIADLYGPRNYIVEGGESTAGTGYGMHYTNGGHIRILDDNGHGGSSTPSAGLVCEDNTDEGIASSPAVGGFLANGQKGIVVGTDLSYPDASQRDTLIAIGTHCGLAWSDTLDGSTLDSPALVFAQGVKQYDVAEGTSTGSNSGTVYLINGTNGHWYWTHNVVGQVIGGITSADLGAGYQDLLVPTTTGLYILDGKTGRQLALLGQYKVGMQSSALVTDDIDGRIGITAAGYNAQGGYVMHWEVENSKGSLADEKGAWPMFHHDPQLTGTTITPAKV